MQAGSRLAGYAPYMILILFTAISGYVALHHEPWRDEAQAWLIVRDCPDLGCVERLMGYEGTPMMWHLAVYPLAKLGLPYESMAAAHFIIAVLAVSILVLYSPFNLYEKLLLVLGYFLLFEYTVVARSYILTALFLFLAAAVYRDRFTKPAAYSLTLALLANTTVHGLVAAVVIAAAYAFESLGRMRNREQWQAGGRKFAVFSAIALLGFAASAAQLSPPQDLAPSLAGWYLNPRENILLAAYSLGDAFLPAVIGAASALFAVPFVILTAAFFYRRRFTLGVYLAILLAFTAIFAFKHAGMARHHGIIFLSFIFCLWTGQSHAEGAPALRLPERVGRLITKQNLSMLFIQLLYLQVFCAFVASYEDATIEYSTGREVALFLAQNNFTGNDTLVATYHSEVASSALPYLPPGFRVYQIERGEFGSYVVWDARFEASHALGAGEIASRLEAASGAGAYGNVILVLGGLEGGDFTEWESPDYALLANFSRAITSDKMAVYRKK